MNDENINTNNLELATNKQKMFSFVVDDLLVTFIAMYILWTPIENAKGDYYLIMEIMNTAFWKIVIIKILYQSLFIWYYGATLGKMMFKIKVIDFEHFGKISLAKSVLRATSRILSESLFYLGFILSFYVQSRQTLHDKISKTLVVNA